jgi:hypothetical protein
MIRTPKIQLLSSKNHILSLCTKIGEEKKHMRGRWLHTYTRRTAPGRQSGPSRVGVVPPLELAKDGLTMVATEPDGTWETPDRWVNSITTGKTLIPFESEITGVRWGCRGKPIDGPVFVRVRLDQRSPIANPTCQLVMSQNGGRVMHYGD